MYVCQVLLYVYSMHCNVEARQWPMFVDGCNCEEYIGSQGDSRLLVSVEYLVTLEFLIIVTLSW